MPNADEAFTPHFGRVVLAAWPEIHAKAVTHDLTPQFRLYASLPQGPAGTSSSARKISVGRSSAGSYAVAGPSAEKGNAVPGTETDEVVPPGEAQNLLA